MGFRSHIRRRSATLALGLAIALAAAQAAARTDPNLRWRTLETAHFQVHYAAGLEPVAERVARIAESAHRRLVPALGWDPSEVTHIVLYDDTDSANGMAFAIPYNMIRLFVSAPSDLSTLSDYDDWFVELVVHEYAHVLHLDRITGIPAIANAIVGKSFAPNQAQPQFIIEGIATYEETARTSAGRGRASYFDMLLRMDVLEGRFASLDEVASNVRRWPHSNIRYLYGGKFFGWLARRFGEDVIDRISHEYGRNVFSYDINRVLRRATGHGYVELWDEWHRDLRAEYGEQARAVRERGLSRVTPLTDHGETVQYPRFSRDGSEIVYYVADGHQHAALRSVAPDGTDSRELAWANSESPVSFMPNGDLVFQRRSVHEQVNSYDDLFRLDRETGRVERLTRGLRASAPDVSPDGESLAFTVNGRGTTHLWVSDRDARRRRMLVESAPLDQVYTPRWSPDGSQIAYSAWHAGGYRDIHVVDVATGRVRRITHDRALDIEPAWSPDGRTLYFTSDRTGIANVYAFDVETRELRQVTNVIGGAYQPDVSPDGRTLVFASYGSRGFDLVQMPLAPAHFLPALAPPVRPPTEIPVDHRENPIVDRRRYDAAETLRPRFYSVAQILDGYGDALALTTTSEDAVGLHNVGLQLDVGLDEPNLGFVGSYRYGGTRPDLGLFLSRSVRPGRWRIDGELVPYDEEVVSAGASSYWSLAQAFRDQAISLGYTVTDYSVNEAPRAEPDPNQHPPRRPDLGRLATLRLGWLYSNSYQPTYGISPESGRTVNVTVRAGALATWSDYDIVAWDYRWTEYLALPWPRHHVLALRVAGGVAWSDFRSRGLFSVPAFPIDQDIVQSIMDETPAPAAVLRGYLPGSQFGNQYHLWNAEYRFPILSVERGPLTFPLFLNRLHGGLFVDAGAAFSEPFSLDPFRVGVGGEVLVETTLAYVVPATFRLGWAKGISEGGIEDLYFVFGGRF